MDMSDSRTPGDENDPLRTLETRLLALEAQAGVHQSRLRDYEKSLVERIADVDDDRRRTAVQIQRTIETQRSEQEDRLRRRIGLLWGALALLLILALAGSFALFQLAAEDRSALAQELAALRDDLRQVSVPETDDAVVDERLAELGTAVARLSAALQDLQQAREQSEAESAAAMAGRADAAGADAAQAEAAQAEALRLASEIERLESRQQELASTLLAAQRELATRSDGPGPGSEGQDRKLETTAAAAPEEEAPRVPPEVQAPEVQTPEEPLSSVETRPESPPEQIAAESPDSQSTGEADAQEDGSGPAAEPADGDGTLVLKEPVHALQLIGFRSLSRFRAFAARVGLDSRLWYLQETYQGGPWYSLIAGLYPDYEAAQAALAELPEEVGALQPWIRPLVAGTSLGTIDPRAPAERPEASEGAL